MPSPSPGARSRAEAEGMWPESQPCSAHQQPDSPRRQSNCLAEGGNGQTRRFRLTQNTDKIHSLTLQLFNFSIHLSPGKEAPIKRAQHCWFLTSPAQMHNRNCSLGFLWFYSSLANSTALAQSWVKPGDEPWLPPTSLFPCRIIPSPHPALPQLIRLLVWVSLLTAPHHPALLRSL